MGTKLQLLKSLLAQGVDETEIEALIDTWTGPSVDAQAERRRSRDREYQAKRRQISAESADIGRPPIPPNGSSSSPPAPPNNYSLKPPLPPSRFNEFWDAYPKREGRNPKKPAKLKFDGAIKRGDNANEIIAGAARYAQMVTDPKFVAMAQTWLNQESWKDDEHAEQSDEQRYQKARERFRNGR